MKRVLVLMAALGLGGCISLLPAPPPPPRVFALEAGEVAPLSGPPVDAVIGVPAPNGERAILGADLVWRSGDELAYVARTQWSARGEEALQAMLIETLTRQGQFRAALRLGEARGDLELRWEVLDFEVREADMKARFVANVTLLAATSRRVLATDTIIAEIEVADRSSSVAADALTRAAREGSARIGRFAYEAAAAQPSAASISR